MAAVGTERQRRIGVAGRDQRDAGRLEVRHHGGGDTGVVGADDADHGRIVEQALRVGAADVRIGGVIDGDDL